MLTPDVSDLHRDIQSTTAHRVAFTHHAWDVGNAALQHALAWDRDEAPDARMLVVVDRGFLDATPNLQQQVETYFATHAEKLPKLAGFRAIAGNETAKNDLSLLEGLLRDLHALEIDRRSYVLAIGGGAVLDMVGFAAAVTHRGVRLIRMPTTTLAQCDSGVGVKNGVNMFGSKNFIGTFAVPHAVLNDLEVLHSLPDDAWHAGLSEAVKVALLKDADFFAFLETHAGALRNRDESIADEVWPRSAQLHLDHIAGRNNPQGPDPFEARQARPLDLGHWAAHRLEELTDYQLSHGNAVAIGLALDLNYAAATGLCNPATAQRAPALLTKLGLPITHPLLTDPRLIPGGLESFRQHLGGQLTITLINDIAKPVDVHAIDHAVMKRCAKQLSVSAQPSHT